MKTILVLFLMLGSSAYAETQEQELAAQAVRDHDEKKQSSDAFSKLLPLIYKQVMEEIELEARDSGMNVDQYIKTPVSMERFIVSLDQSDISILNKADKLILLLKTRIRLKIQQNIRFIPPGHFEREAKVFNFLEKLAGEFGGKPQ